MEKRKKEGKKEWLKMAHKEKSIQGEQLGICWDIMTGARKFLNWRVPYMPVLIIICSVASEKNQSLTFFING